MDSSLRQCTLFDGQASGLPCGKTCPELSPPTADETLLLWLEKWLGWNRTYRTVDGQTPVWRSVRTAYSNGAFWMRSSSEFRSGAVVSSLSGILETGRDRPPILLERESLCGDTPARRKAREEVAGALGGGAGERGWRNDLDRSGAFVSMSLNAKGGSGRMDGESETFVASGCGYWIGIGGNAWDTGACALRKHAIVGPLVTDGVLREGPRSRRWTTRADAARDAARPQPCQRRWPGRGVFRESRGAKRKGRSIESCATAQGAVRRQLAGAMALRCSRSAGPWRSGD